MSISHRKLMRVLIAGAVIGSPLALCFGIFVVERAEIDLVRREAQALIAAVRAREAEVTGILEAVDRLQTAPCSLPDLEELRTMVLRSSIIIDIVRRQNGRLACSAVYGATTIDIPALASPGVELRPGERIWRYAELPQLPGHKFIIVGHGDAFTIVRPSAMPPDLAPNHMSLSRFFVHASNGHKTSAHISWFAGKPVDVSADLLQDGKSFWHNGNYVAVACATDRMMCLVLQAPWAEMLFHNVAPFEIFGLTGGLVGSAASLSLLAWSQQHRSTRRRLRHALRSGQLALHYQPIMDVQNKAVVGAEALMRWPVDTGIPMGPDEFIPIAEDSGIITELTCFAIRRVAEELGWLLRLRPDFLLSINIVADDLSDERFHAALSKHIIEAGISPSQIALELTERRSAEVESANAMITQLRRTGYKIYIDDFGTGFSSLTYLSDLTIDAIKIDKSFTSAVNTDAVRARLVPPILEMAKDIGVPVIAEGVETEFEAAYFRDHGVLRMQGRLFGRPVEAVELLKTIQGCAAGVRVEPY